MMESQGGRCRICHRPFGGTVLRAEVDHDHKTGMVRAILCGRCNRLLALAGESQTTLRSALEYLSSFGPEVVEGKPANGPFAGR